MGETIVFDIGSETSKVGFAVDEHPLIFPSITGSCLQGMVGVKDSYVCKDAQTYREYLTLTHPVQNGVVTDWESLENIWTHILHNELKVGPEDHPVLLTENPRNPRHHREKMTQLMFESLSTPSMYIAMQAVLSLFTTGFTNGIAVQAGHGVTHTVPVYQGNALHATIQHLDVTGQKLTESLHSSLTESGYTFTGPAGREIVQDIKEKLCYVATETNNTDAPASLDKSYTCPDGQVITIGNKGFRWPEALFEPSLFDSDSSGIHQLSDNSIKMCDIFLQNDMYTHMVLTGGTTLFPGIAARMHKEMENLAPPDMTVQIISPPERKYSAWIGGSILASLLPPNLWISKQEYDELGSHVVHHKCF